MKYPIYIIKEKESKDEIIYKYSNFKSHIIGSVRVNLDNNQVMELKPLPYEQTEGSIFQQVVNELISSLKRHIMFFLETKSTSFATYLVLDHHHNVLGKINLFDNNDEENLLNGNNIDFLTEQIRNIKESGFPASYFTRSKIEHIVNSLYILQTHIYKENVDYIYMNDYDISAFGRICVNKNNGRTREIAKAFDEEDGVYELVENRVKSCYTEQIFHEVMVIRESRQLVQLKNEELNKSNLPHPYDNWGEIFNFSLTFNAYKHWGTFEEVVRIADDVEHNYTKYKDFNKNTLTELRTNLFIIQRGCNHRGEAPTGMLLEYIHNLIEGIRLKVKERNF